MNLIKWFRRNRMKMMVIFGVALMVGFIGGSQLMSFLKQQRGGGNEVVGLMGQETTMTRNDIIKAQNELQILRLLGVHLLLQGRDMTQTLLGELVLTERGGESMINNIRDMVRRQGYPVSSKQIDDIYRAKEPDYIYWHLLKKEAEDDGIVVSKETAAAQLADIIPRMTRGQATYGQYMQSLLQGRGGMPGLSEDDALGAFAKLLAVLDHARQVCTSEPFTLAQLTQTASAEMEKFNFGFVKFDTALFAKGAAEPQEAALEAQFEKYKDNFIGDMSAENPYGFGYKVPDRVKLEYLAVKLEEVEDIVAVPTQEEIQAEYRKRVDEFTRELPIDANDPNSGKVQQRQPYAEVADMLAQRMLQERVNSMATRIMQDARGMLEAGLTDVDLESAEPNKVRDVLRAVSYEQVAAQLSEKYKVKVYAGCTGMLGASDIATGKLLGQMVLGGQEYQYDAVPLVQIVFAIDEIGATELGPFEAAKPRMYETIGPFKERFIPTVSMLVRVTDARKAAAPESLTETFSTKGVELGEAETSDKEQVYSVRERVVEDVKKLAVRDEVKGKAEEFVGLVGKEGWEPAAAKFNELYGKQLKKEPNDPNVFKLENLSGRQRITARAMETVKAQLAGMPGAEIRLNGARAEQALLNEIYSLVPVDSNSLKSGPAIVEFKGDISFLVVKDVVIDRINQAQFSEAKPMLLLGEEDSRAQALAFVYYNPENISQRLNFRWLKTAEETGDADADEGGAAAQ